MKFVTGKLEVEKKLAGELVKFQSDENSQMLLETFLVSPVAIAVQVRHQREEQGLAAQRTV